MCFILKTGWYAFQYQYIEPWMKQLQVINTIHSQENPSQYLPLGEQRENKTLIQYIFLNRHCAEIEPTEYTTPSGAYLTRFLVFSQGEKIILTGYTLRAFLVLSRITDNGARNINITLNLH